jgi:intracellular sulfur oxidation DsrE/DsrF family protein
MRRTFMQSIAGGLLAVAGAASISKNALAAEQIKVVYHLSEGLDQATRALANIRNHLNAEPNTKIVAVAHGEGIRFLLDGATDRNGRSYEGPIAALASQGVEFRVCNNTLNAHDIPASKVVMEAKVVPSGVAEVARLQAREGFAYLHP